MLPETCEQIRTDIQAAFSVFIVACAMTIGIAILKSGKRDFLNGFCFPGRFAILNLCLSALYSRLSTFSHCIVLAITWLQFPLFQLMPATIDGPSWPPVYLLWPFMPVSFERWNRKRFTDFQGPLTGAPGHSVAWLIDFLTPSARSARSRLALRFSLGTIVW